MSLGQGLRSRKIDFAKPLRIYFYDEVEPEIMSHKVVQRGVPCVSTGVEKEEEKERHLQAALSGIGHETDVPLIPTPDVLSVVEDYDLYYKKVFKEQKSRIRFSGQHYDAIGCLYNIDEEDEEFINAQHKFWNINLKPGSREEAIDFVENFMWHLETYCNSLSESGPEVSFLDAKRHIEKLDSKIFKHEKEAAEVFKYWKNRRYRNGNRKIMPLINIPEKITSSDSLDPYACFRKREVKPLKKARRLNAVSRNCLRNIKSIIENGKDILDLLMKVTLSRKQCLETEHKILEEFISLRKMSPNAFSRIGNFVLNAFSSRENACSRKLPEKQWCDFTEQSIQRKKPRAATYWSETPLAKIISNRTNKFSQEIEGAFVRKRIGRNGRVFLDRHVTFVRTPDVEILGNTPECNGRNTQWDFDSINSDIQTYSISPKKYTDTLLAHRILYLLTDSPQDPKKYAQEEIAEVNV